MDVNECETAVLKNIKTDFISTLSHELRTPLTSIKGFAETLLSSSDMLSEEQKRKFLLIIKEQADRLIKLSENLLAASKTQNDNENLVFKSTDVKPFIEKCTGVLVGRENKNRFKVYFADNLPKILVDTDKFQQIMFNILENALKYSNAGTEIKIEVFSRRDNLVITVSDEGIEILPEDRERIFQKFTRLSNHLTQRTEGSGLGLYITKQLTERMRGTINVASEKGITTFTITFPGAIYGENSSMRIQ